MKKIKLIVTIPLLLLLCALRGESYGTYTPYTTRPVKAEEPNKEDCTACKNTPQSSNDSKSDTGVLSNIVLYSDAAKTQLVTGETGKIYQNVIIGEPAYQFRWTGTAFAQTGANSLIIGEVSGTAYDGAKGKANADNIAEIQNTLY